MRRREFIAASVGFASLLYPHKSVAQIALANGTLTTVSDGTLPLPFAMPEGVPAGELSALAESFGLVDGAEQARPLHVTLWETGDRLVLFDAGSGPAFVDSAGQLYENLDAAGYDLSQITDVVFTHAHPDHIWGIIDDFDEIAFPEAQLWIGQDEYDYWIDPATTDRLDETRKFFAVGAKRRLEAIAEGLAFFGDGDQIMPGVVARATYGHTPGHMSFVVGDGEMRAMVLGDAVTNEHLQFARPGWPSANDENPELAAQTRETLMAELADTGMPVIGYHLPGNGIGQVQAGEDGFVFIPQ